ncbi:MAG: hypothetical protein Q9217_004259 [Psora testacea]
MDLRFIGNRTTGGRGSRLARAPLFAVFGVDHDYPPNNMQEALLLLGGCGPVATAGVLGSKDPAVDLEDRTGGLRGVGATWPREYSEAGL